jgi:hypothetical protein
VELCPQRVDVVDTDGAGDMPGAVAGRIPVAAGQRYPGPVGAALARVVSVALTYLPYAGIGLVAYAVWRTAMLGRLSAGAHIGAGQAKVLCWFARSSLCCKARACPSPAATIGHPISKRIPR